LKTSSSLNHGTASLKTINGTFSIENCGVNAGHIFVAMNMVCVLMFLFHYSDMTSVDGVPLGYLQL
jgi:hypothetical protein